MGSPPWLIGVGIAGSAALVGFVIYESFKGSSTTAAPVTTSTTVPPSALNQTPPAAQAEFPIIPNPADPNYHVPQMVDGTFYIIGALVNASATVASITSYLQSNDWTNIANVTVGVADDMFTQIAPFAPLAAAGAAPAFFCQATWHTGTPVPEGLYAVSEIAYQTNPTSAPLS